ncbi:Mub1p [Sugiyamaella lignohabitans]|uniref:Mub1p n=1 Tax=Sugiyamaella lignohabitans TaxID=796027 RepID=A0A167CXN9_9ASCO|nr:Mub1p [Sugiyamaella lignohabitans]ANB12233.1 Mub1p [Sugiyamaella lignohabitans]
MRELNFRSVPSNRAAVSITTTLYDRRALDCTADRPLVNSLNHLTYLASSSARVRETLCVDGGLERLVAILKECRDDFHSNPAVKEEKTDGGLEDGENDGTNMTLSRITKEQEMLTAWKWTLALQCLVFLGTRGTEQIRSRVVDAGLIPVITTILDNYLYNTTEKTKWMQKARANFLGKTSSSSSSGGSVGSTGSSHGSSNGVRSMGSTGTGNAVSMNPSSTEGRRYVSGHTTAAAALTTAAFGDDTPGPGSVAVASTTATSAGTSVAGFANSSSNSSSQSSTSSSFGPSSTFSSSSFTPFSNHLRPVRSNNSTAESVASSSASSVFSVASMSSSVSSVSSLESFDSRNEMASAAAVANSQNVSYFQQQQQQVQQAMAQQQLTEQLQQRSMPNDRRPMSTSATINSSFAQNMLAAASVPANSLRTNQPNPRFPPLHSQASNAVFHTHARASPSAHTHTHGSASSVSGSVSPAGPSAGNLLGPGAVAAGAVTGIVPGSGVIPNFTRQQQQHHHHHHHFHDHHHHHHRLDSNASSATSTSLDSMRSVSPEAPPGSGSTTGSTLALSSLPDEDNEEYDSATTITTSTTIPATMGDGSISTAIVDPESTSEDDNPLSTWSDMILRPQQERQQQQEQQQQRQEMQQQQQQQQQQLPLQLPLQQQLLGDNLTTEQQRFPLPIRPAQGAVQTATSVARRGVGTTMDGATGATNATNAAANQADATTSRGTSVNSSVASAVSAVPRQFREHVIVAREEDIIWALEILAFVSKYAYLKPSLQNSHIVPRLSVRESAKQFQQQQVKSPASSTSPRSAESNGGYDEMDVDAEESDNNHYHHYHHHHHNHSQLPSTPSSSASTITSTSSPETKSWNYDEYDFEAEKDIDSEYLGETINIFPLVEKFTVKQFPKEIQYWAGVIMRNSCRRNESLGGIRQCANFDCGKWEEYPRQFAKCRRCKRTKYCSKNCQLQAWNFHRHWCVQSGAGSSTSSGSSSSRHTNSSTATSATSTTTSHTHSVRTTTPGTVPPATATPNGPNPAPASRSLPTIESTTSS